MEGDEEGQRGGRRDWKRGKRKEGGRGGERAKIRASQAQDQETNLHLGMQATKPTRLEEVVSSLIGVSILKPSSLTKGGASLSATNGAAMVWRWHGNYPPKKLK